MAGLHALENITQASYRRRICDDGMWLVRVLRVDHSMLTRAKSYLPTMFVLPVTSLVRVLLLEMDIASRRKEAVASPA